MRAHLIRAVRFVLIAGLGTVQAQVDLDSIRKASKDRSLPDSTRLLALFDLAWEGYLFSDPDSADVLADRLQDEARAAHHNGFEARAYELKAAVRYVHGDMHMALQYYDTALTSHERNGDLEGQADVIGNMASMRSALGQRDEALVLYVKGLKIHRAIGDSTSIANDLNAMGTVHMARGDHARAADLYTEALHLHERMGNERGRSTGRANMGSLMVQQGDHSKALPHFREALRLAEKIGDRHMAGMDLEEIGSCLEELGDTSAAMRHFEQSLAVRKEIDDARGMVNVLNRIGALLLEQGDIQKARKHFEESIALATTNELPWGLANAWTGMGNALLLSNDATGADEAARKATKAAVESEDLHAQRDATELLFKVLNGTGRWKEAINAHVRLVALNDSIMREENQRAVLNNEYRYAYQAQARTDSISQALVLEKERATNMQRVQAERSRLYIALLIGALISAIAIFIFLRARLLARTNAEILAAQTKLVESERQREASEVRTRIARDVHDQLGSDLTKLVMLSSEINSLGSTQPEHLASAAADIERVASEANRSLGDIVWAVDPHHDSLAGLTERVRAHCERMLKWSKVKHTIDCLHEGPDRTLDPAMKRDIYLILRESLNNAIKYAQATHIGITLHSNARHVKLVVQDNGLGLGDRADRNGHGLANMEARAARIGARFHLDGTQGTTIRLDLELQP